MATPNTLRVLALSAVLALGLGAPLLESGCIIPDYCIVVSTPGTDWCVQIEEAVMWPIGQPQLAEPVRRREGGIPLGCACMNDGETQILQDQAPLEAHTTLVEKIQQAARYECAASVPPGYDHNCLNESVDPNGTSPPSFPSPFMGSENSDCVGSCAYTNKPPKGSCGPNPNPWQCAEFGDGTGGSESTADSGSDSAPIVDEVSPR